MCGGGGCGSDFACGCRCLLLVEILKSPLYCKFTLKPSVKPNLSLYIDIDIDLHAICNTNSPESALS